MTARTTRLLAQAFVCLWGLTLFQLAAPGDASAQDLQYFWGWVAYNYNDDYVPTFAEMSVSDDHDLDEYQWGENEVSLYGYVPAYSSANTINVGVTYGEYNYFYNRWDVWYGSDTKYCPSAGPEEIPVHS